MTVVSEWKVKEKLGKLGKLFLIIFTCWLIVELIRDCFSVSHKFPSIIPSRWKYPGFVLIYCNNMNIKTYIHYLWIDWLDLKLFIHTNVFIAFKLTLALTFLKSHPTIDKFIWFIECVHSLFVSLNPSMWIWEFPKSVFRMKQGTGKRKWRRK